MPLQFDGPKLIRPHPRSRPKGGGCGCGGDDCGSAGPAAFASARVLSQPGQRLRFGTIAFFEYPDTSNPTPPGDPPEPPEPPKTPEPVPGPEPRPPHGPMDAYLPPGGLRCMLSDNDKEWCETTCTTQGLCVQKCAPKWDPILGKCWIDYKCDDCNEIPPDPDNPGQVLAG